MKTGFFLSAFCDTQANNTTSRELTGQVRSREVECRGQRSYLNVFDAAFMEEDRNVIFLIGIFSLRSS
jgi:hypothetical protein